MHVFPSPLCKPVSLRPLKFIDQLKGLNDLYLRQQQRKKLSQLSDHALDDMGITRDQANTESQRWFWQ